MTYKGYLPVLLAIAMAGCAGAQPGDSTDTAPQLGPGMQRLVDIAT